jgi:hypothetical protein
MNVLGRLLMELREQLKSEKLDGLQYIEPLLIPEFLLFNQPIEPVQSVRNAKPIRSASKVITQKQGTPNSQGAIQISLFDQPKAHGPETPTPASTTDDVEDSRKK